MIRKTKATQYNYGRKPEPIAEEPESMSKARHLPLPGPGVMVTVPLHLWPAYKELHGLEAIDTKLFAHQPLVVKVRRIKKADGNAAH